MAETRTLYARSVRAENMEYLEKAAARPGLSVAKVVDAILTRARLERWEFEPGSATISSRDEP